MQRRQLLVGFATGAAAAAMPTGVFAATLKGLLNTGTRTSINNSPDRASLTTLVGSWFRITDTNGQYSAARLIALDDGPTFRGLEQFSLVFQGKQLTDGLFQVFHPQAGEIQLHFMPSGETADVNDRRRAHISVFA
jgi:hypothetical protein